MSLGCGHVVLDALEQKGRAEPPRNVFLHGADADAQLLRHLLGCEPRRPHLPDALDRARGERRLHLLVVFRKCRLWSGWLECVWRKCRNDKGFWETRSPEGVPQGGSNNTKIPRENRRGAPEGGANSGALAADPVDPDLARVVAAWPTLPSHVRAAVMALIQTAR
jgi:hypothetical protein